MKFAGREISLGSLLHRRGSNPQIQERLDRVSALKGSGGTNGDVSRPSQVASFEPDQIGSGTHPAEDGGVDQAVLIEQQMADVRSQMIDGSPSTKAQDAERLDALKAQLEKVRGGNGNPNGPDAPAEKAA